MNYESENRVIAQRWGRLLPTIGGGSSLAYIYFSLDLVPLSALLSPRTTPEASEDMDISTGVCETGGQCRGFTPLGIRMVAQLAGGNLSLIPSIREVMMRYRNIIRMNDSYYIAKRPIKTACSSVVYENDMVYVIPDKYCRNGRCGCSRLKRLIVNGLYTSDHAYSIADIHSELANYDMLTGRSCEVSAEEARHVLRNDCIRDAHQQRELYRMINKIAEADGFFAKSPNSVVNAVELCVISAKEILEELQRANLSPWVENASDGAVHELAPLSDDLSVARVNEPDTLEPQTEDNSSDLMDILVHNAESHAPIFSHLAPTSGDPTGPSKEARMKRAARMEARESDDEGLVLSMHRESLDGASITMSEDAVSEPVKKSVVVRKVRKIPANPTKQTPKRAAKARQASLPADGRGKRWSANETEQLRREYAANVPISEIAELHKRTEPSIRSMITNSGMRFTRSSKYI